MTHQEPIFFPQPGQEEDEASAIVAVLRQLKSRTSSPVVRTCLEEACEEILHLAGQGLAGPEDTEEESDLEVA